MQSHSFVIIEIHNAIDKLHYFCLLLIVKCYNASNLKTRKLQNKTR